MLAARNTRLAPGDIITLKIRRFDRSEGVATYEDFSVPYQKWMRVLDALNYVAEQGATDLADRWFCGSKMFGTCAVRLNGREVLACWEAVEPQMTIEPLRNLPVIRDLVVDRTPYENKVASLEPWIERTAPYPHFPEPLTHKQMKEASKALDCISCMCCYSACPVIRLGHLTDFAGPAPLVQLGQTALDPRNDPYKVKRSLALTGIFNCVSCYKCEEVCPASIPIVSRIIEPLKAKAAQLVPEMAHHSLVLPKHCRKPRPRRPERAGSARARIGCAVETAAHSEAVDTRQGEPDQNNAERQDRRGDSSRPFSWQTSPRKMKYAYYPGCSARSTCAELNEATHAVAAKLGLELLQLDRHLHRRQRNPCDRSNRILCSQCTHLGFGREPPPAAHDDLQHLHIERAGRTRSLRKRRRSCGVGACPAHR